MSKLTLITIKYGFFGCRITKKALPIMQSKLKNTVLSIKRQQRHLKLAFIIANEKESEIATILNWCSFNVCGPASLIFTLKSLEKSFNKSLLKEHSPDFLVKVGDIADEAIKELERCCQPFDTWDYMDLIKNMENDPNNISNSLEFINWPKQKCLISQNDENGFKLLSTVLFGYLSETQKVKVKKYIEFNDANVSSEDFNIIEKQQFGGLINYLRFLYWPASWAYNTVRCYETYNPEAREPRNICLIIDDFGKWEQLSLYWNLKAHFTHYVYFIPSVLFKNNPRMVSTFLFEQSKVYKDLTILSNSLNSDRLFDLLKNIQDGGLKQEKNNVLLELKKGNMSNVLKIKIKDPTRWTDVLGKIRMGYGKHDEMPAYFSEYGGTIIYPEGSPFEPKVKYGFYAVDFQIPFLKPAVSQGLRYAPYGLGLGSQTRISASGLTSLRGGLSIKQEFVFIRALDSINAIKAIFEDYNLEIKSSNNGAMAIRFLDLLKGMDRVLLLSGEDIISLLKQANPLFRDENNSTVKKNDEDAAIEWGRVQQYLNIDSTDYLKKTFAEKIVSWMISHGLLKVGTKVRCNNCYNKQWIPVNEIRDRVQCSACFSEIQLPIDDYHHLNWNYLMNLLLGRAIDQGFLTTLLTLHFLIYENSFFGSDENMTYFCTGIDVFTNDEHICELDFIAISEGEKIVGECKLCHDLSQVEINKLVEVAELIEADVAIFSTIGNFSEECLKQISGKAQNTKVKLVVLQKEQLLNQMYDRQIAHMERKGVRKSYRQIFVEHVIKNNFQ